MKKRVVSKKFDCAKDMPPLLHSTPGQEFDIQKSEVAKWLCAQPSIMQYVFTKVSTSNGGLGLIEYDRETNIWKGINR